MKLALIIIGSLCLVILGIGLFCSWIENGKSVFKVLDVLDVKTFLWVTVGTVCLIFGFCL